MEAHDICDSLAHETEGVRACVVLDLNTGFTLLSSRRAVVDAAEVRRVIQIACLVCQNKLLGRYAATLSPPQSGEGLIREAHVSMTDAHIFMASLPNLPNGLMICETDKTMNIGFGWIAVHRALERFAGVPPESLARLEPEPEPAPEREPEPQAMPEPEPQAMPAPEPHAVPERDPVPAEPEPAARTPVPNAPAGQVPRRRGRQTPSAGRADTAPMSPRARGSRPGPAPAPAATPAPPPEPPAQDAVPTPDEPPRQARLGARAGFGARPPKDRRKR